MVNANEFSHVVKLGDIGAGITSVHLAADAEQRAALAKRFDLQSLDLLEADLALSRDARGVLAEGRFRARLAQYCVATRDPVPAEVDEEMMVRFITEPATAPDAEIELDADECDTMFHDGQGVDVGEAVAQSLSLALNPYPRSACAEAVLKEAGVVEEEAAGPFGALATLRDKLGKS